MSYESIKTLKDQTRYILSVYPESRNDDCLLVQLVCNTFSRDRWESVSSIERFRRMFNQRGEYLPTKAEVAKTRRLNMDAWRVIMGYPTIATSGTDHPSWLPPLKEGVNKIVSANQQRMF